MLQENCTNPDDLERFVRLYADAQRRLFSFIQTLVYDWASAEEVLQEANVTIWEKRADFDLDTNFMHWANRIAYHKVLKFREKSKKNRVLSDESLECVAASMLDLEDSLQHQSQILDGCLKKLSEKDLKLISQRYFNEISVRDLSEILGRSTRSIYCSLQRVHGALRRCILQTLAMEGQES